MSLRKIALGFIRTFLTLVIVFPIATWIKCPWTVTFSMAVFVSIVIDSWMEGV